MTTFSQLKTDIADWTARSDLGTKLPRFIALAEDHIDTNVRLLSMETDAELTTDASGEAILPTGFLGFTSIEVQDQPYPSTEWMPPDAFRKKKAEPADGERVIKYTIESNKLKITTSAVTVFDVTYFAKLTRIGDSNPTNALLTNHFNVYLWACLALAWDYLQDRAEEAIYWKKFNAAVEDLHRSERRSRTAGPLVRQIRRRVG